MLHLDPEPAPGKITIWRYKKTIGNRKFALYKLEGELPDNSTTQVVLVSVENITALKLAYPNYFLDTDRFSDLVKKC